MCEGGRREPPDSQCLCAHVTDRCGPQVPASLCPAKAFGPGVCVAAGGSGTQSYTEPCLSLSLFSAVRNSRRSVLKPSEGTQPFQRVTAPPAGVGAPRPGVYLAFPTDGWHYQGEQAAGALWSLRPGDWVAMLRILY